MGKRNKPKTPDQIALERAEARAAERERDRTMSWGVNTEALNLPANEDASFEQVGRGNLARAKRYDVFSRMYYHPKPKLSTPSYEAVRRLQRDLAILHRTNGASDEIRTIGSSGQDRRAFGLSRVEAGQKVHDAVHGIIIDGRRLTDGMKSWAGKLLLALCETEVVRGQTPNWHAIVQQHTGAIDRLLRADLVRRACDDLAESYGRIDQLPRSQNAA